MPAARSAKGHMRHDTGLTHLWPRTYDHKVAWPQATGESVKLVDARSYSGQAIVALRCGFALKTTEKLSEHLVIAHGHRRSRYRLTVYGLTPGPEFTNSLR